jgi:hypothetical protein
MKTKRKDFLTYEEAKVVVSNFYMDINNILDYRYSYKEAHKNLPANPDRIYIDEWVGWNDFLGKN